MAAASSPLRRPFAVRYSLRMLLLALTAFAIGFPIWYRWPYEESGDSTGRPSGPFDPFASPPGRVSKVPTKVVTTWQRQWGGGRLMHGHELTYVNGKLMSRVTYRNGERHGPSTFWRDDGAREFGEIVHERKDGVWTLVDASGKTKRTATWRDDRLDGPYVLFRDDGTRTELVFADGKLASYDGNAISDPLSKHLAAGTVNEQFARELGNDTKIEFVETPLKDAIDFLMAQHGMPLILDPHHGKRNMPISGQFDSIQLASALAILAAENGHACDYRYGMIWVTSAEDAIDWHDPTGVAEIQPPKDSQLAKSWPERVAVSAMNVPLADVLQKLVQPLAIGIDTSRIDSAKSGVTSYPVTMGMDGMPFRDTLGMLLYKTRCRVKLEGETLVILPPADER